MATTAAAIDEAANPKSVESSLWWDSFSELLSWLESKNPNPNESRLKKNHTWFLETVSEFKRPNRSSRSALDSNQILIDSHRLTLHPNLKQIALQISRNADLDEVQSYIVVKQYVERENLPPDTTNLHNHIHLILLHYYIERQCLLKCTRHIIMHTLYSENGSKKAQFVSVEASKLISDGLDRKLSSVLQDLLFSRCSETMDVDLAVLWTEESLIEDNLILDILFLAYYESLCTCNGEQWKFLCLLFKGHSVFTLTDIQEMDAAISTFNSVDTQEAAPLILAWAVFICLISSLPQQQDSYVVMDIDHVGYVRQAFKDDPLRSILQILQSDILKDCDGPVAGYKSVLRTLISAFIASYEITQQFDGGAFSLILEIICEIYRGEESLCVQFWDRDSFIDAPVRSLLNMLEVEFPFRVLEFVRLLSSLGEGSWPAECVYNYLDRSIGISSLFEISGDIYEENCFQMIETPQPFHVPEVEDLLIPGRTQGRVLKVIDKNTALIQWEYKQSGIFVLLLRLARQPYWNHQEEAHFILDLLYRLVSCNKALCSALMDFDNSFSVRMARSNGHVEQGIRVDVIEIVCALVRNLSINARCVVVMSLSVSILAKLLKCSPSHVSEVVLKKNIFDVGSKTNPLDLNINESGMWMLSDGLTRMLLFDCEQTEGCCSLTLSVLEFTKQLVEMGAEDNTSISLVMFCLKYILVNHEHWKYGVKHARWKVTLKALDIMKLCIQSIPFSPKVAGIVKDIILCDPSLHDTLLRVLCITSKTLEKLHVSRIYEVEEIEGLEMAVCSVLDIVLTILSSFPKDTLLSYPFFHRALLSSTEKKIPVVTATMSLISYFSYPAIPVVAANVLSSMCIIAENTEPYLFSNVSLVSDDIQITDLRYSIHAILSEEVPKNEALLVAILKLLTSAALYQPAFLISMIELEEHIDSKHQSVQTSVQPLKPTEKNILEALLQFVRRSGDLIESGPNILLNVLTFLKALWQGSMQYIQIVEWFRTSEVFWKQMSTILDVVITEDPPTLPGDGTLSLACKYQCCSLVLEMLAYDLFLEKKLVNAESPIKLNSEKSRASSPAVVQNILLKWCKSPALKSLINLYASCEYDCELLLRAKLITQPAFSDLLAQYTQRGYSGGKELKTLVLNDLYYHMQGELEGRKINSTPFKELAQFMLQLRFLHTELKYRRDFPEHASDVYIFDLVRLQKDLGYEYWEHSNWKESTVIVEKMMSYMRDANMMSFLASCKLCALDALTTILSVHGENLTGTKNTSDGKVIESCIELVCEKLEISVESLIASIVPCVEVIDHVEAQTRLLLCLVRLLVSDKDEANVCSRVLNTVGSSLRVISSSSSIVIASRRVEGVVKLLLAVLLVSVENSILHEKQGESVMRVLPVLCSCVQVGEDCFNISLATMDLILNGFMTCDTWLPIIQRHLKLDVIIHKLRERGASYTCVSVVMKFLLSLARARGGAEMLEKANFFPSLKVLNSLLLDEKPLFDQDEKRQRVWGLGMTVVTAMIESLGPFSDFVDSSVIPYYFGEKAFILFHNLDLVKCKTSLTSLREVENTLMLICAVAKRKRKLNVQLRETCIHILALISNCHQQQIVCPPILKEELELNARASSFVNCSSKRCCLGGTSFSDAVAVEMYRIAHLILKYLCMEAKEAANRAEEMGFINLAQFPQLPVPEILHGLQDQAMQIVCSMSKETQQQGEISILLLQMLDKSLYLEFCVAQTCGIRPVLGRIEDFTKEFKMLMRVAEEHAYLKGWMKSSRQIISYLHPALLETQGSGFVYT
ncbi:hypothetical protein ACHQM5_024227 [Ranunculus cassubicifolius]